MWVRFFCDTNACWDLIDSREDWDEFITTFSTHHGFPRDEGRDFLLRNARININQRENERPNFGLYTEHRGDKTLGEFFKDNGMEP